MTLRMQAGLLVAATLAVLAVGVAAFIGSGVYNIGADDHHTRFVLALIEQLRERSIAVRVRELAAPPDLGDPAKIAAGARRYAADCAGCHLAPGITRSDIRAGLYPHPPNLAAQQPLEARRAFWIIKHGIKMSGMPAWGRTLDDQALWELVAFVRQLPSLSAERYRELAP